MCQVAGPARTLCRKLNLQPQAAWPTGNVLLSVSKSIEEHPLRTLIDVGLRVTLSTDDPGMFATDMNSELALAHDHHGVTLEQLRDLQQTALDSSFASPAERCAIADQIRSYASLAS